MNELFENLNEVSNDDFEEFSISPKEEWKIMNDFLQNIKSLNVNFYKELEKNYGEEELVSIWKKISFIILKNVSSYVKETIDFEEAKRQNRKKGDGKGKWPSKIQNVNPLTEAYLYLTNKMININFWDLTNFGDMQYRIFCFICYVIYLEFEEKYKNAEGNFSAVFKDKKSKNKKKENDEIEEFVSNLSTGLNKLEKEILIKIIKNDENLRKRLENAKQNN